MTAFSYRPACFAALLVATALLAGDAQAYTTMEECAPTWSELPVTYHLADDGTEHFEQIEALEAIFDDSFQTWQQPCCSGFEAEYGGQISRDEAFDGSHSDASLVFHDDEWPAVYGGPDAIAVTLFLVDPGCEIGDAPIHFNSMHHQFVDGADESSDDGVDLQSIATHEIGHLLGLGHSEFLEATMFAAYIGGTSPRALHDDDIDGVCSLYPQDCECTDDEPCRDDETCEDGLCVPDPCTADDDCDEPFSCLDGTCTYLPCDDDEDCNPDSEQICENNRCVDPCPACRPCTDHADCGHQGYCRPFPHGGRCFISCGQDGQCPGDTVCTGVDYGAREFFFCTAAEASHPNEYCPADFRCEDFDHDFEPCPGLGLNCDRDGYECSPANDVCIEEDDGSLSCSCHCQTNADCGRGNLCVTVGNGQSVCLLSPSGGCEDDDDCDDGTLCFDDECVEPSEAIEDNPRCGALASTPQSPMGWMLLVALGAMALRVRRRTRSASR